MTTKLKWQKKLKKYKWDKPLVLFLPVKRRGRMNMPIENTQSFQWDYFRWHNALINYYISRPDFHFVWKAISLRYGRNDTVSQILKEKSPQNIDFSTDELSKWLKSADRVICDIPSTAFFESIFSQISVLALYRPKDQELRENAYCGYGKSLQPYSNSDEGIKVIDRFLNSDPGEYIVPYPQRKISVPEILEAHLNG